MSQSPSDDIVEARIKAAPTDVVLPPSTSAVTHFKINVPQSVLDDLKRRLDMTRWPNRETVSDWSQGVPLARVRALVEYCEPHMTGAVARRCSMASANTAQR